MNTRYFLLIFIAILIPLFFRAQERGMQPVQVTINGKLTPLYKESHALVIGMSNYTNGLPSLPGVISDISAVKSALEANGFSVIVKTNPDYAALDKAFNDFIMQYGQDVDNRLLFYFAGHGYTQKMSYGDQLGFILPSDAINPSTYPNTFQGKALAMTRIEEYALRINSKHALFLFDACFSGSIFSTSRAIPEIISYKTKEPVRQFITSGQADETVPDKSIFCAQFIRALDGEADGNKDGYITGTELGEYLQSTVVNYSYGSQHPQYGKIRRQNLDQGDFVFVLNESVTKMSPVITPSIETENPFVQYGKLEITTQISGSLYLDGTYMKQVTAGSVLTLKDLVQGDHIIKISGDKTVEKSVTINANKTEYLTFDNNPTKDDPTEEKTDPYLVVEQMPDFPGGEGELYKYVQQSIIYPPLAKEAGITGTVYVRFIVDKYGIITNITLLRGIGGGCDEEAIRVVQNMSRWTPGRQDGKPVPVYFTLPVKFILK